MRRIHSLLAAATVLSVVACHHAASVASAPVPQRSPQAAHDSALAADARGSLARRDSAMEASRLREAAERNRLHADSVRVQVQAGTGMEPRSVTHWGLSSQDSAAIADRIHFAFDRSDLTAEDYRQLDAKRQVLLAHPNLVIQVAGNCDERGSDEYNLALGQRRAQAAKRWLVAYGIDPSRITTVSYGEERPLELGHNEVAWAHNRRDDFLVRHPAQ